MDFPSGSWSISSVGSCSVGSFSRLLWHSQRPPAVPGSCSAHSFPAPTSSSVGGCPSTRLLPSGGPEQPAAFLSTAWAASQQSAFSEIPPCERFPLASPGYIARTPITASSLPFKELWMELFLDIRPGVEGSSSLDIPFQCQGWVSAGLYICFFYVLQSSLYFFLVSASLIRYPDSLY